MISPIQPIAILDACVLYPAPVRDLLLCIAEVDLYIPKWTDRIHQEWSRNLLLNRPDLSAGQLAQTINAIRGAFPTATVIGYESLMDTIQLPDPNDVHVLAAAILSHAQYIVTANLKDFPQNQISKYRVEAKHPDTFLYDLIELDPEKALLAFRTQVLTLRKPLKTAEEVAQTLRKTGLQRTADKLLSML